MKAVDTFLGPDHMLMRLMGKSISVIILYSNRYNEGRQRAARIYCLGPHVNEWPRIFNKKIPADCSAGIQMHHQNPLFLIEGLGHFFIVDGEFQMIDAHRDCFHIVSVPELS